MRSYLRSSLVIVLLAAAGCGDGKPTTDARDGAGDGKVDGSSSDRADVGGDKPATGGNGGSTTGTGGDAGTGTGGNAGTGTGGSAGTGTGGASGNDGGVAGNDGGGNDGAMATCNDGIKNSDETGVDCGGHCGKCAPGGHCEVNADCQYACRADKTCAACAVAADCPGTETECEHRTCTAGVCGSARETAGTVLAVQATGDCKRRQCAADGTVANVNDDIDVPDDRNPCTNDVCTSGAPSHTTMPANSNCGGANHCNANGQCIGCSVATDCPGSDTACRTRTCTTGGVCGFSFAAAGTKLVDPTAGDCKGLQCDGNGNEQVYNVDTDVPVDNNVCTTDECSAGTPAHRPVVSGTNCGGSLVCDGASKCVECLSASTCPGTDAECHTRSCMNGACGVANMTMGTLVAAQTARDCKKNVCNGQGGVTTVNDDLDLPVDSNACTFDVCTAGTPSNPNVPAGNSCGSNTICDGQGACVTCLTASSCPGTDTECHHRTCTNGVCGIANTAAGTALSIQTAGDCKRSQCDGNGASVVVNDDNDKPVDGKACTSDICTAGVPSNPNLASGTACGTGQVCNATGDCVGCNIAADCGTNTTCQTHTCTNNVCGVTNAAAGTLLPNQTTGDCKRVQCDGQGQSMTVNDDTDKLVDGNACTQDLCNGGIASNPPEDAGTACSQNNGMKCNGSGTAPACVQCLVPTDCPGTDTDCRHRTCTAGVCGFSNTADGTLVDNAAARDCQKNVCMSGAITMVADNADLPNDDNPCTDDSCSGGVPQHNNLSVGVSCGIGQICDAAGLCVGCVVNEDCPNGNACQARICGPGGVCGFTNVTAGVVVTDPAAGDCHRSECDGNGNVVSVIDNNDKPAATSNDCLQPTCTAGAPSQTPLAEGAACAQNGGTKCNATGTCVECINATECGADGLCVTHTCDQGVCGVSFKDAGTPTTSQVSGDCKLNICDGAGSAYDINDSDPPAPTNQCMTPACNAGSVTLTPEAAGTSCSNNGVRCNGAGACVPTFMAVRVGDGSAALTSTSSAVFIEERAETDGTIFRTISVPSTSAIGTSPKSLTLSGVADSDGHLALSADGHYVTLAGYNAPAGTSGIASTATTGSTPPIVPRIAASINLAGTVDTTTTFGTAFNTDNVRSAVSNDGGQFWAGGNCSGSGCVRGVLYAVDGASTSTLIESTSASTRVCIIALGALYCDAAQGSRGIFTVGTGLPTTAATTSLLTGTADSNAQYYGLAVFDLTGSNGTPDGVADTIYVADERAPATPAANGGGIKKWTVSGGTWSLADTFNNGLGSAGVRGLAAHTSTAGVVLIATTAITSPASNPNSNAILKYVDTGAAASTVNPTTLQAATAGANRVYRGVAVSPK